MAASCPSISVRRWIAICLAFAIVNRCPTPRNPTFLCLRARVAQSTQRLVERGCTRASQGDWSGSLHRRAPKLAAGSTFNDTGTLVLGSIATRPAIPTCPIIRPADANAVTNSAQRSQGSNQSHCHERRNMMASMTCHTQQLLMG